MGDGKVTQARGLSRGAAAKQLAAGKGRADRRWGGGLGSRRAELDGGKAGDEEAEVGDGFEERVDEEGVEVPAAVFAEVVGEGVVVQVRGFVEVIRLSGCAAEGVVGVEDADDSSFAGASFADESVGVSAAVPALVVVIRDGCGGDTEERRRGREELAAEGGVAPFEGFFLEGEFAGVEEDGVGEGELADVVKGGELGEFFGFVGAGAEGAREDFGVRGEAVSVGEAVRASHAPGAEEVMGELFGFTGGPAEHAGVCGGRFGERD